MDTDVAIPAYAGGLSSLSFPPVWRGTLPLQSVSLPAVLPLMQFRMRGSNNHMHFIINKNDKDKQ